MTATAVDLEVQTIPGAIWCDNNSPGTSGIVRIVWVDTVETQLAVIRALWREGYRRKGFPRYYPGFEQIRMTRHHGDEVRIGLRTPTAAVSWTDDIDGSRELESKLVPLGFGLVGHKQHNGSITLIYRNQAGEIHLVQQCYPHPDLGQKPMWVVKYRRQHNARWESFPHLVPLHLGWEIRPSDPRWEYNELLHSRNQCWDFLVHEARTNNPTLRAAELQAIEARFEIMTCLTLWF